MQLGLGQADLSWPSPIKSETWIRLYGPGSVSSLGWNFGTLMVMDWGVLGFGFRFRFGVSAIYYIKILKDGNEYPFI